MRAKVYRHPPALEPNTYSAAHGVPSIVRGRLESERPPPPSSYDTDSAPLKYHEEVPRESLGRVLPELPERVGSRTRISGEFIKHFSSRARKHQTRPTVRVRCDCGRVDEVAASSWRNPLRAGRSCRDCANGGRRKSCE